LILDKSYGLGGREEIAEFGLFNFECEITDECCVRGSGGKRDFLSGRAVKR
jgi:hypothetical protein